MKTLSVLLLTITLLAGFPMGARASQDAPAAPTQTAPSTPSLVTRLDQPSTPPTAARGNPDLLAQVQTMIKGGADEEVVKAFVQNWSARYSINSDDILHLHDLGASSAILTALIRRSAELQALQTQGTPNAPATVAAAPAATAPANAAEYPEMANPPSYIYPYPSSYYPAYTYSYLYPYTSYRYAWSVPYSYSFYYSYGWPYYRYGYWGHRPYYGYGRAGYSHGWNHAGSYGHAGYRGTWSSAGGYRGSPGGGRGAYGGGGGHGRR